MSAVRRLNHAVLYVRDVEVSSPFYVEVLGFEVATSFPGAVFLRASATGNDHDLGLFSIGDGVERVPGRAPGLYHLAWQVDTIDDLAEIRARLLDAGALVGESDHGVSKSLYAVDPDGIEFEVMWAVPRDAWPVELDPRPQPLALSADQARWAGVATVAQSSPT